jgi:hypothetical protein
VLAAAHLPGDTSAWSARPWTLLTARARPEVRTKALVDGVVYRGGDALAAWLTCLPPAALFPGPRCGLWLLNALWLARGGEAREGAEH